MLLSYWISIVIFASSLLAGSIYLPGVSPHEYTHGELVELKVNSLTSVDTQLPYGYYTLAYCKPDEVKTRIENLGEILSGDEIQSSPYALQMQQNETCKILCTNPLTEDDKANFKRKIDRHYKVHFMVGNLPAATRYTDMDGKFEVDYMDGFLVGVNLQGSYYVHNHLKLILEFHRPPADRNEYRIVGFEVEPSSMIQGIQDRGKGKKEAFCSEASIPFDVDTHDDITYTYDVIWSESPIRWASRWDVYMRVSGERIHWISLITSATIMVFLSGLVAIVFLRTVWADIRAYNELSVAEPVGEERGWKLLHADVFREPPKLRILCATIGAGVQVAGMALVTITFAAFGLFSPARRGVLLQSGLLLLAVMGAPGGYCAARLQKVMRDTQAECRGVASILAFVYPGLFFTIFFVLNLFIWGEKSAGAVPFGTLLLVLLIWFGVSVPCVLSGVYLGFKSAPTELPVKTGRLPRNIPKQSFRRHAVFTSLLGGCVPFLVVFTELYFIMSSIWLHGIYYVFIFLAFMVYILTITSAQISIILTYSQLVAEDHRWWWRSFFASGSSGLYVFLYAIIYFFTQVRIVKFVSALLYFGYMFVAAGMFSLFTGAVGFLATFMFVRAIYGSVKID